MHLVEDHLPHKLAEVAADRLTERVPKEYLKRTVASALASKMVYSEGIQFIEMQVRVCSSVCVSCLQLVARVSCVYMYTYTLAASARPRRASANT